WSRTPAGGRSPFAPLEAAISKPSGMHGDDPVGPKRPVEVREQLSAAAALPPDLDAAAARGVSIDLEYHEGGVVVPIEGLCHLPHLAGRGRAMDEAHLLQPGTPGRPAVLPCWHGLLPLSPIGDVEHPPRAGGGQRITSPVSSRWRTLRRNVARCRSSHSVRSDRISGTDRAA